MLHWQAYFSLQDVESKNCSPECIDFINRWLFRGSMMIRLITSADQRMGRNGVEEIMSHPWMKYVFKVMCIIGMWIGKT